MTNCRARRCGGARGEGGGGTRARGQARDGRGWEEAVIARQGKKHGAKLASRSDISSNPRKQYANGGKEK